MQYLVSLRFSSARRIDLSGRNSNINKVAARTLLKKLAEKFANTG
jgi:hypothetical protein